tara:strand:- start:7802 stop:8431 length:630 start_codon:yes stop_codon:yes gene_type:complete
MIKNLFWKNYKVSNILLNNYDHFVNNLNCNYVWKCNQNIIKDLYKNNLSKDHIEIGPGTGYFLKKHQFNSLYLVDINHDILNDSFKNLKNNSKEIFKINKNIFSKNKQIKINNVNSIGLSYVLHCVPNTLDVSLNYLVNNLNQKDITLFGSTVIPTKKNFFASSELYFLNKLGIFNNLNHNIQQLKKFSKNYEHEINIVGNVLIFKIKI